MLHVEPSDTSIIYRSTDRGNSWEIIETGADRGFHSISMLNPEHGVMSALTGLAITYDSCKSCVLSPKFPDYVRSGDLLQAIDKDVFLLSYTFPPKHSTAYLTTDGGKSWRTIYHDTLTAIRGVHFKNINEGCIIGMAKENCDTCFWYKIIVDYTYDGGNTWSRTYENDDLKMLYAGGNTIKKVKFYDKNLGVLMGFSHILFQTTDGGKTWHDLAPPGKRPDGFGHYPFYSFGFIDRNTILAHAGLYYLDSLLKIPLIKTTSVEDNQNTIGGELSLFPNPNDGIINFSPPLQADYIAINDLTGRTLLEFNNPTQIEKIDINHLSSGVYFLRVKKGTVIKHRIFLKL